MLYRVQRLLAGPSTYDQLRTAGTRQACKHRHQNSARGFQDLAPKPHTGNFRLLFGFVTPKLVPARICRDLGVSQQPVTRGLPQWPGRSRHEGVGCLRSGLARDCCALVHDCLFQRFFDSWLNVNSVIYSFAQDGRNNSHCHNTTNNP